MRGAALGAPSPSLGPHCLMCLQADTEGDSGLFSPAYFGVWSKGMQAGGWGSLR